MNDQNVSIEYSYRLYRVLVFTILLLLIIRFVFNDAEEMRDSVQLKYAIAAVIVFMFMERHYPSIRIDSSA